MSYILDALQKSDRERALENVETLPKTSNTRLQTSKPNLRWLIWVAALSLVLILVWRFQTRLQQTAQTYWQTAQDAIEKFGLTDSEPVSEKTVETPAQNEERVVEKPLTPLKKEESTVIEQIAEPEPKLSPTEAMPESDIESIPQQTLQANVENVVESPEEPKILSLNLAPDAVRQNLSALTLSAVSYSKDAERRFVLINDQLYREGDGLPGGTVVEEITSDGIVVASDDVKVFLRP